MLIFGVKVRPHYVVQHRAAQRGKAMRQKLISMGSKNAMRACMSTLD